MQKNGSITAVFFGMELARDPQRTRSLVLNLLARLGSGFDIVSGGELKRVVAAGGDPAKTVFSGVGKSEEEMRLALSLGILCFNVESHSELLRLERVAREMKRRAPVSLRVNPDVDARTHPYISTGLKENKFGVAFDDALERSVAWIFGANELGDTMLDHDRGVIWRSIRRSVCRIPLRAPPSSEKSARCTRASSPSLRSERPRSSWRPFFPCSLGSRAGPGCTKRL